MIRYKPCKIDGDYYTSDHQYCPKYVLDDYQWFYLKKNNLLVCR